jgi:hypothetical protein
MSIKWKPLQSLVVMTLAALVFCGVEIAVASAFMLNMDGSIETPGALYVKGAEGKPRKILEPGWAVPGGGTISELGVPTITKDGALVFAAEVTLAGVAAWQLFRARPFARELKLEKIVNDSMTSRGCRPVLKVDPHVSAGPKENVAFIGEDGHGHTALFLLSNGQLDCAVRFGDLTSEGHRITNLGFGSAQVAENGAVVFHANLSSRTSTKSEANAILLAEPGKPPREVAVEGTRSPNGGKYGPYFGSPAIIMSGSDLVIAFTNHTRHNVFLFVGSPGRMHSTIGTAAKFSRAPFTYLSDSRPALADDGSVAIEATQKSKSSVLVVRAGESFVVAQEGDKVTPGQRIVGFGDLIRTKGGRIAAEAVNEDDINRVYSLSPVPSVEGEIAASVLTADLEAYPLSFTSNPRGEFAFLSRARPSISPPTTHMSGTRDTSL